MSVAVQRTKRRQQREETRRQIMDAAEAFLRERSFRELSVEALMARTGHSRTVFYRHFDDVPSLVMAMIEDVGAELVELSERWAQTEQVSPEEARGRLEAFVDFYVRNGPLVRAVAEAAHHDELVEAAYSALIESFVAITTSAIEERVERGELTLPDGPEVARALVWMLNGYLADRLGSDEPAVEPERVLETVWTVWTRVLFGGS